jgi:hypothetical protein
LCASISLASLRAISTGCTPELKARLKTPSTRPSIRASRLRRTLIWGSYSLDGLRGRPPNGDGLEMLVAALVYGRLGVVCGVVHRSIVAAVVRKRAGCAEAPDGERCQDRGQQGPEQQAGRARSSRHQTQC